MERTVIIARAAMAGRAGAWIVGVLVARGEHRARFFRLFLRRFRSAAGKSQRLCSYGRFWGR
eukprot:5653167-Prymnesium_polylepis.1